MEVVTLHYARENNLKYYFTGVECKNGHVCERYTKKSSCVLCAREDSYKRSQLPKVKEQNRKYKKTTAYKQSQKKYKNNDQYRSKERERERLNRVKNPDKYKEKDRKYRIKHKNKRARQNKEWLSKNPLNTFTRQTLRRIERKKDSSGYEELLGYSQEEFKNHIESLFVEGMSWDKRSLWHVDHIIPVKFFIDSGITDIRIINSLDNLQPLWASDNQSKGAKLDV